MQSTLFCETHKGHGLFGSPGSLTTTLENSPTTYSYFFHLLWHRIYMEA